MSRGEYLRCAALGVPPSEIPELNREAWVSLSRAAGNLNQLAKRLAVLFSIENDGGILDALGLVDTVKSELDEFRDALIGADLEGKN